MTIFRNINNFDNLGERGPVILDNSKWSAKQEVHETMCENLHAPLRGSNRLQMFQRNSLC